VIVGRRKYQLTKGIIQSSLVLEQLEIGNLDQAKGNLNYPAELLWATIDRW
jgi:hypothetical protein